MEIVDIFGEKINVFLGITAGLLASIFGNFWWLFAVFAALNVADYITGWVKARYAGQENSSKGAHGIWKKAGYWLIIAIAFFVSLCFVRFGNMLGAELGFLQFIGWFTLASYIINEIRSILENIVAIQGENTVIPAFLIKGLNVAQKLLKDKEGSVK